MIVNITKAIDFTPIKVEITLQSLDEAVSLLALVNMSEINIQESIDILQKYKVISKKYEPRTMEGIYNLLKRTLKDQI